MGINTGNNIIKGINVGSNVISRAFLGSVKIYDQLDYPTLDLNFAATKSLDPRITFTRASSGTYFDAAGVLQTAAANTPRFDHDPVTLLPRGLLIEGQRTNLVTYSEQFDNAAWTKTRSSITANTVVAPDGTLTGDKVFVDTQNGWHYASQSISITSGTTYTLSLYAKKAEQEYVQMHFPSSQFGDSNAANGAVFNLTTGAISDQGGSLTEALITSLGNGWYRCSITKAASSTGSALIPISLVNQATFSTSGYTGDGTSGIYIWGAQLEAGSGPATSYIPTVAAQVTRSVDAASMTGTNFSSWYRQDEGTLFAEYSYLATGISNLCAFSLDNGTSNETIVNATAVPNIDRVLSTAGGISQANFGVFNYSVGQTIKRAVAIKLNDAATTANGLTVSTDNNYVIPAPTQLVIGAAGYFSSSRINGHIRRIAYYPRRLANTELQLLTS